MQILKFENDFDATLVTLNSQGEDYEGPYVVAISFHDPAIGTSEDNKSCSFPSMIEAKVKFLELVNNEIDAIIAEI